MRWHFMLYGQLANKINANLYVYIPTAWANDEGVVYSISAQDKNGWGGRHDFFLNQATRSGWYSIGYYQFQTPYIQLQLEMRNVGPRQGEYAGASAAAISLHY